MKDMQDGRREERKAVRKEGGREVEEVGGQGRGQRKMRQKLNVPPLLVIIWLLIKRLPTPEPYELNYFRLYSIESFHASYYFSRNINKCCPRKIDSAYNVAGYLCPESICNIA